MWGLFYAYFLRKKLFKYVHIKTSNENIAFVLEILLLLISFCLMAVGIFNLKSGKILFFIIFMVGSTMISGMNHKKKNKVKK